MPPPIYIVPLEVLSCALSYLDMDDLMEVASVSHPLRAAALDCRVDLVEIGASEYISDLLQIRAKDTKVTGKLVLTAFRPWKVASLAYYGGLTYMGHLRDLTGFEHLYQLELYFCPRVADLTPIKDIRVLTLINCDGVTDLSVLRKLNWLELDECNRIKSAPTMEGAETLMITNCTAFFDLSQLKSVSFVYLQNCAVFDLSPLKKCKKVHLFCCDGITDISPLDPEAELIIEDCPNVMVAWNY